MLEQVTFTVLITIRECRESDLLKLEWFGLHTPAREIITTAFQRQQKGEVVMLVAETNHFPIGQIWIDLTKRGENNIGFLWALRVMIPFQSLGIGTRLIVSAESLLKARGFYISELSVGKDNPDARRLYERLGYHIVRDNIEEWQYTPPGGTTVFVRDDGWILHKSLTGDGIG